MRKRMWLRMWSSTVALAMAVGMAVVASAQTADESAIADTPAFHPTERDVSLKIIQTQYPYLFIRCADDPTQACVATQTERDALENYLFAVATTRVLRAARQVRACKDTTNHGFKLMQTLWGRLAWGYPLSALMPRGSWQATAAGRHYSDERYTLQYIQACFLQKGAVDCATNPAVTDSIRDLLNLQVVDGKCVRGASFPVPQLPDQYDVSIGNLGKITTKAKLPALTPEQMALLHATHLNHAAVSDWRCGVGPQPGAGLVAQTHQILESLAWQSGGNAAQKEAMRHFLRIADFSGDVDPAWSQEDVCRLARLQDRDHMGWHDAVMAGKWGEAWWNSARHQADHICMNLKDPRITMLYPCGTPSTYIFSCPKITCSQLLDQTFGDTPQYGVPPS